MGFLKKILDAVTGGGSGRSRDREGLYIYVKCGRCGTPVRVRVSKYHDLQRDYDTGEMVLRKEIMDDKCFRLMDATVRFDPRYQVIDRKIQGGEFITEDEYRALTTTQEPSDQPPS
jgi:hypothetical protein